MGRMEPSVGPAALEPWRGGRTSRVVLFLVLMTAYAVTACRTVGPGDSGELTAAMCTWGVAHAPGYPVLILLGNLVSHVPHAGEPAFLLNLLDALFAALACVVLSAAVGRLTGRPWAGFAAGLALGTSRIFWEYALVVEVFSLNALMAALLLDLFSRYLRSPGPRGLWALPASAAVMASALTHHLTLVLVALPVGVSFAAVSRAELRRGRLSWPELRGALGRSLLWGAAALLPLLYIPLAARRDPALDWGDVRDLQSFLHLLLRRDFGSGWLTPPGVLVRQHLDAGEGASPFPLRHLGFFWADLPRSFGWAFPALLPLGFLWAWQRCRLLLLMGGLFLAALVMFFARVNAPVVPLYVGITRPFYILPHVVIALLM